MEKTKERRTGTDEKTARRERMSGSGTTTDTRTSAAIQRRGLFRFRSRINLLMIKCNEYNI